jgi:hypothetical protein
MQFEFKKLEMNILLKINSFHYSVSLKIPFTPLDLIEFVHLSQNEKNSKYLKSDINKFELKIDRGLFLEYEDY